MWRVTHREVPMRLLIVGALGLLVACARSEESTPDSEASPTTAALTEADQAGTWVGTAKGESGDTTTQQVTVTCEGTTCRGVTSAMPNDTTRYTFTIAGDSVITTSDPVPVPGVSGKIIDKSVHRISGTTMSGYGWVSPVGKPDSVIFRYRFQLTKQ